MCLKKTHGLLLRATSIVMLMLAFVFLPFQSVSGQYISPLMVTQTPANPISEGAISFDISGGTESEIIDSTNECYFIFSYDTNIRLNPDAEYTLYAHDSIESWFFTEEVTITYFKVDTFNHQIEVKLTLPPGESAGGHGYICTVASGGAIIVVIDPNIRVGETAQLAHDIPVFAFLDSKSEYLAIRSQNSIRDQELIIELLDMQGRLVYQTRCYPGAHIPVGSMAKGVYTLTIKESPEELPLYQNKINILH